MWILIRRYHSLGIKLIKILVYYRGKGMSSPEELVLEAERAVNAATEKNVILRVFGGVAIRVHCPSTSKSPLLREIADVDFFGLSKQSGKIQMVFKELGYIPAVRFNAVRGRTRLLFYEPKTNKQRDIFLDTFDMCHCFDLRKRLTLEPFTIPLTNLFLTKLQIIELNERDYKDLISLLLDHEVGEEEAMEVINGAYIATLCAKDWGMWKTFTRNLEWITYYVEKSQLQPLDQKFVKERIDKLRKMIDVKPKSVAWKLRSTIGERMLWYNPVEEVAKTIKFE